MITENTIREMPWNGIDVPINPSEDMTGTTCFLLGMENDEFPGTDLGPEGKPNESTSEESAPQEQSESILPMSTYQAVMAFISELPQKILNRVADGLTFNVESPESEIPAKKPNMARSHHNKQTSTDIARGRGRGRGRSQLRRSGVSQARHRQERIRQSLSADIMDDLNIWEDFDDSQCDDMPGTPLVDENGRRIRYSANGMEVEPLSRLQFAFTICDIKHEQKKKKKNHARDQAKISSKVRYLPNLMKDSNVCKQLDDDEESEIETRVFRTRLQSERSVDSEDSCCIVFEISSDSEYDIDYTTTDDEEEADGCGSRPKVRFSRCPTVHRMIKWDYAYRAARRGPWEQMARDRERFKARINCIGNVVNPILLPQHRSEVWQQRFAIEVDSC